MPESICENCGGTFNWSWPEAFDKFGFRDGDGQIETWQVSEALETIGGCKVNAATWGCHNTIITSIKLGGVEQIPETASVGYDDPREYLPAAIVALLDAEFGE